MVANSPDDVRIAAILVAAGIGSRFARAGEKSPKQFLMIGEHPVWVWPFLALLKHSQIKQIVIATIPDMVDTMASMVAGYSPKKNVIVTAGGATRQDSVRLSLAALAHISSPDYVLIHDAARPFLTEQTISDTVESVLKHGACTVGVTASDTVKKVAEGVIVETLDRKDLVLVQTPQAGRFEWLYEAHNKAKQEGTTVTDDAAILEFAGHKVVIVKGNTHNFKITEPEDLELANALAPLIFK